MEKANKIINIIKENKWIHYAIIVIIGIILSIPLCEIQIRDTHDGMLHFLRIFGTVNTFELGEIPPIVAPHFCNSGGYAMNLFYNPIVTYIPLLLKMVISSYAITLKVFASLCIIFSGITMYQFTKRVTKNRLIGLFSAIIYMLFPYKLCDIYRRYAIGEFASFIFIPIVFSGLYNLFKEDGKKHYCIAIGAAALVLTHTLTALFTAIFSVVYILFNISKLKDFKIIKKLVFNGIIIVLISACFIFPMFEAKSSAKYAIFDKYAMATYQEFVYDKAMDIQDFFDDKVDKYTDTITSIGLPMFIIMCATLFTYKSVDKKYKDFLTLSIFFSIISLYMCTKYCPWLKFPDVFCKIQFPWRMMTFFNFFAAFIIGVNIYIITKWLFKNNIIRTAFLTIIISLIIAYSINIVLQFKTDDKNKDEGYINGIIENPKISHFYINRDYLPMNALLKQKDYVKNREYRLYILSGNADIKDEDIQDLKLSAEIQNVEKDTIIEMPFFYYPGYEITLEENGVITKIKPEESENGYISLKVDKQIESAKLDVKYVGTVITKVSYIISTITIITFTIYIIIYNKKNKEK